MALAPCMRIYVSLLMAVFWKPATQKRRASLSIQEKVFDKTLVEFGSIPAAVAKMVNVSVRSISRNILNWAHLPAGQVHAHKLFSGCPRVTSPRTDKILKLEEL